MDLKKNYLQKYQQIYPENADWNHIEYKLQLNLGNSSATLKRVYCVANPFLSSQFDKENKGYIISESFIKPEQLFSSNRIERVCHKGFEFPSNDSGLQFIVGQIDVNPQQKPEHELLMVKICPKKSYPCFEKDVPKNMKGCPTGFDSIYYNDKNEEEDYYRHRFRLYKKNQVLPCYVIQFSFNEEHEKQFKQVICQNCQDEVAIYYCKTEKVYFCYQCNYEHHKDKISAQHIRNLLKDSPVLDFGNCKNHQNFKNELFCKVCCSSLCMTCKISGDHAEEFMGNHELFRIQDYYLDATKRVNKTDNNLDKRKYQFQQLLCFLDDQVDIVNRKTIQLQKQLKQLFEKALMRLEYISKHKLSYIMSEQLEVRRQYDYIQWMESFFKYQKEVLPSEDFLIAWTKHEKLRKEVLNISNIPSVTQIRSKMKITGSIDIQQVLTDEQGDDPESSNLEDMGDEKIFNIHLDKYMKSSGKKGPSPVDFNPKNNPEFRKKLIYSNDNEIQ